MRVTVRASEGGDECDGDGDGDIIRILLMLMPPLCPGQACADNMLSAWMGFGEWVQGRAPPPPPHPPNFLPRLSLSHQV